MKSRGFLIGLVLFAVSVSVAYMIGYSRVQTKAELTISSTLAMSIEQAMRNHLKRNEIYPEGTAVPEIDAGKLSSEKLRNKKLKMYAEAQTSADRQRIATALHGERALAQDHLNIMPFIVKNGELVDTWNRPFIIGVGDDKRPFAISPGPNGKFGDDDDVTSKEAKKTAKLLEED